jgi:hypothetical protein
MTQLDQPSNGAPVHTRSPAPSVAAVLAALLVLALAVVVAVHEWRIYAVALEGDAGAYLGADGQAVRTLSVRRDPAIAPCVRAYDQALLFGTVQEARDMIPACLAALDGVLARTPANGDAWQTRARLLDAAGSSAREVAQALVMSGQAAPHEGWIARSRLGLSLRVERTGGLDQPLATDLAALIDRDILTLVTVIVQGQGGRLDPLALTFLDQDEQGRARITRVIETLDENLQNRFVSSVRRSAAGG